MNSEDYALRLGRLMMSLSSLEFLIRAILQALPGAPETGLNYGESIYTLTVGTKVPEAPLTDYATLGQLIKRYNYACPSYGDKIDENLAEIRDAIAHGRASTEEKNTPLRLIKFSKEQDGFVTVTHNFLLDDSWFSEQQKRVGNALTLSYQCYRAVLAKHRPDENKRLSSHS